MEEVDQVKSECYLSEFYTAGPQGRRKRQLTSSDKLDENENTRTPDGEPSECKGKESKGGRWIPRLQEAKKDAASCENLWVGASNP